MRKPCPDGKKYCIILDNAPWHSPDLNSIEQVWRITRREKTHNRYFSSLEKLTNTNVKKPSENTNWNAAYYKKTEVQIKIQTVSMKGKPKKGKIDAFYSESYGS